MTVIPALYTKVSPKEDIIKTRGTGPLRHGNISFLRCENFVRASTRERKCFRQACQPKAEYEESCVCTEGKLKKSLHCESKVMSVISESVYIVRNVMNVPSLLEDLGISLCLSVEGRNVLTRAMVKGDVLGASI